MRATRQASMTAAVTLGLASTFGFLSAPGLWARWIQSYRPAGSVTARWCAPPPPHSPSEAALRAAWRYQTRAEIAAVLEFEALEEWDPQSTAGQDRERWRRQFLARDGKGDVRRARCRAEEAAALAQTAGEAGRAAELLFVIERDTCQPSVEGQQPRWGSLCHRGASQRIVRRYGLGCDEPEMPAQSGPDGYRIPL